MAHRAGSPRFPRALKATAVSGAEHQGQCPETGQDALGRWGGQLAVPAPDAHGVRFTCLHTSLTLLGVANCMVRKGGVESRDLDLSLVQPQRIGAGFPTDTVR